MERYTDEQIEEIISEIYKAGKQADVVVQYAGYDANQELYQFLIAEKSDKISDKEGYPPECYYMVSIKWRPAAILSSGHDSRTVRNLQKAFNKRNQYIIAIGEGDATNANT